MSVTSDRPTRWEAARTAALLGALFVVVYGGCSFLTSLRSDVGTWYYAWERHIPFLPIFILPYQCGPGFRPDRSGCIRPDGYALA